ncbi:DUF2180 family protein [Streptomyces hiroshimensis]|uniref:DUF2180 family protein n=1 Tax=Streptomyces hiroshimensis TaxID=66424 RepID=A0ABQ2Y628_9ACTN|nr:DUF2180 family protein [Streptomyces hiroshimensis]GGX66574.1 hypothetical protein GCM10010324_09700 [Streptomyces hiroshimensis]
MNCYDCYAADSAHTPAVAVCHGCHSGLCPDHLRMIRPVLHRPNGMGVSHGPTPARQVLCLTCHAARNGLPAAPAARRAPVPAAPGPAAPGPDSAGARGAAECPAEA